MGAILGATFGAILGATFGGILAVGGGGGGTRRLATAIGLGAGAGLGAILLGATPLLGGGTISPCATLHCAATEIETMAQRAALNNTGFNLWLMMDSMGVRGVN